jgi:hypothetical protein
MNQQLRGTAGLIRGEIVEVDVADLDLPFGMGGGLSSKAVRL